ncbi:hypothetical protein [Streptantibioticus cattleyicolor]|uniref:Uncharacterized protein n=1 Tax=Streptantibioticus cattleyicolor (strain ATCC 35852 / DSM 46488 / JCM 4925 / NBRC 14057 / NRRL 8057) TaxID=1003195 RepID=F8JKF7_STREN|nr:hypothetical protein [Streptantibioticus cattleyicolor]AEW99776.1 hypothetical protein SCATT_p15830 [Streptantibioticus cattleyicolor NRRL 8057 = DSM 46488]CCB71186.1 protein of unknown function [Streptantibioticus cattleyicolor NRRL 8057 = DSM 46488]
MPEPANPSQLAEKEIVAEVYEGVDSPLVELTDADQAPATPRSPRTEGADEAMPVPGKMSISLESIDVEVENQSFGMITASTGCFSNIGGPSC